MTVKSLLSRQLYPSPVIPVIKKVLTAILMCYIHVTLVPGVPLELLTGMEWDGHMTRENSKSYWLTDLVWYGMCVVADEGNIQKLTFIQLMFYILIATTFVRLKYYVAWVLSKLAILLELFRG